MTEPIHVLWDGTPSKPLGRQLCTPEESRRPAPALPVADKPAKGGGWVGLAATVLGVLEARDCTVYELADLIGRERLEGIRSSVRQLVQAGAIVDVGMQDTQSRRGGYARTIRVYGRR
jgi:hypothetical protein